MPDTGVGRQCGYLETRNARAPRPGHWSRAPSNASSLAADHLHGDARQPLPGHADDTGGALGEIDDAPGNERPAVIDGHVDRASVAEMLDAHLGAERQRPVRRRHGVGVEDSARGEALALPIVGGNTVLAGAARAVGGQTLLARCRRRCCKRRLGCQIRGRGGFVGARTMYGHLALLALGGPTRDLTARLLGHSHCLLPLGIALAGVSAPSRPYVVVVVALAVDHPATPGLLWRPLEVARALRPIPPASFHGIGSCRQRGPETQRQR